MATHRKARIPLTERETDVLELLARGFTYDECGAALSLSVNTVRTHVRAIYAKLEVSTKTEAALEAIRRGLVSAP